MCESKGTNEANEEREDKIQRTLELSGRASLRSPLQPGD